MPSPFPGMDPWLEHPEVFPDLHDRLNIHLSESLQVRLPAPYFAAISRRVWIEVSHRFIGPDLVIRPRAHSSRGTLVHVPHDERHESLVEIFVGQGKDRRLVTSIEILSWANKTPGEHGRELYLRKQREVLDSKVHLVEIDSKVHLVEIDLLRGGTHTSAVPRDLALTAVGPFDYHVSIHHFDNLEDYWVFRVQLEDKLPEIEIPLLPGDPPALIDLQAVFQRCYEAGPYAREVRYVPEALDPPLPPAKLEWACERLPDRPGGQPVRG